MEQLQSELNNISKFEEMARKLFKKDILDLAKLVLTNCNLEQEIKPRDLLSCWIISKFPTESVGAKNIQYHQALLQKAYFLNNIENMSLLKKAIQEYIVEFNKWKDADLQQLTDDIFQRYHQLTVDIMNAPEESKEYLNQCKQQLLVSAKQIGGPELVNKILSYSPVVIDTEELQSQYDKAFWDIFTQEYNNKKYDILYSLLENIKDMYCTLTPSRSEHIKSIIDVDFIKQRISNDAYTPYELKNLTNNIFDIIKSLQSPGRDDELEEFRSSLQENNLNFPEILKKIVELTRLIVIDLQKLKRD